MADLEAAADLALARTKQLEEHADEAQDALAAFEEHIERLAGQLEADTAALSARAREVMAAAGEHAAAIAQECQEAAAELGALEDATGSAHAEAVAATRRRGAEAAALTQGLQAGQARVEALAADAQAAFRALAAQAAEVESQVEQALDEARQFVGVQVVEDLQAMREELVERAGAVRALLADECAQRLDDKYSEWEGRLAEIEAFVAKAFTDAGQHAEEVVAFSLEECAKGHAEALDDVKALVDGTLEPALRTLEAAVADRRAELQAAAGSVEAGLDATASRLEAAIAALEAVRALLASYTFVQA
jgi:hypothetical protein